MNVRFAVFLAALVVAASTSVDALPTVHPGVHRKAGTVELVIELAQITKSTLGEIKESAFLSCEVKITATKNKLQAQNSVAVSEATKLLGQEIGGLHEGFKNFWIANQITVSSASFELVEKLAVMPSISNIREQELIKIEKRDNKELVGQEWGVKLIGANKVWADGNIGQGVIVVNIDTGVHGTHEVSKRNFLGKNGWFDPETLAADPYDIHGYSSHIMGTIAGSKGVDVPQVSSGLPARAATGTKFVLCPHDTNGENADCSLASCVAHNNWGDAGGRPYFKPVVDAWVKAGIPGDYPNVIGVGATTSTDSLAYFSSKGPIVDTLQIKPDIMAPGDRIRSADFLSEEEYWATSGSSNTTPHVTGAIALLLSAQPELTMDEVKVALYTTTNQTSLSASGYIWGETSDLAWSNNQYGHGRLNVLSAFEAFRPAPSN